MPMTFKQIYDHADEGRLERAKNVVITQFKFGIHKKTGMPTAACKSYSRDDSRGGAAKPDMYVTRIDFLPKRNVKVACSCSDFTYRFEWALAKKGAAEINYSNGQPPNTTNPPPRVLGCCKHCIKLYQYMSAKKMLGG